jgi:acyl-CoA oxidase
MQGAGKAPPEVFDAWMHRESDTVQATTQAFGEREVLEAGMRALKDVSSGLKRLLEPIIQVRFGLIMDKKETSTVALIILHVLPILLMPYHPWSVDYGEANLTYSASLLLLTQLYAVSRLEADLGYFLTEGLIDRRAGAAVVPAARRLCADVAPRWQEIIEGFGIPRHLVAAPIAGDWTGYNAVDNKGEVLGIEF